MLKNLPKLTHSCYGIRFNQCQRPIKNNQILLLTSIGAAAELSIVEKQSCTIYSPDQNIILLGVNRRKSTFCIWISIIGKSKLKEMKIEIHQCFLFYMDETVLVCTLTKLFT